MKKVLVASAALLLAGGLYASAASAAEVKPGVVITGDARVRLFHQSDNYVDWGNNVNTTLPFAYNNRNNTDSANTDMDSRVRFNITGTAAGGAYVKARIRLQENLFGDADTDTQASMTSAGGGAYADIAHVGIPFTDQFTLEAGKYRNTYGPMPGTYNFFYDDVQASGVRGIVQFGDVTINPFIEWVEEAQNDGNTTSVNGNDDKNEDNDAMRFGVHVKGKVNKDWTVGGMLGYQSDERRETPLPVVGSIATTGFEANEGFFASIYTNGKAGAFGLVGELAVTDNSLNNFNSWEDDASTAGSWSDRIGSDDTGFGGFIFPNYQIDKLNIGLNLGFTTGGFQTDRAFGFVMLGSSDNSKISAGRIGDTGDWLWAGLVASYQISEAIKLTGNLVYADIDAWDSQGPNGEGPYTSAGAYLLPLDSAWELSAVLQYTVSKGADLFFSAGYLAPSFDDDFVAPGVSEDGAFGIMSRFELKF